MTRLKQEQRTKNRRKTARPHAVTKALRAEVASLRAIVEQLQAKLDRPAPETGVSVLRAEVASLRQRLDQPSLCDKRLPCGLPRGHLAECHWPG